MSQSDEELMACYQAGSVEAFEALYQRHARRVLAYLRKRGVSPPEDVAQEVFLRFHTLRHRYDGRAPVVAWLFVICRSVMVDWLRRSQRASRGLRDLQAWQQIEMLQGDKADLSVPSYEEFLSREQAHIVRLRYEQDEEFAQIARQTGLTEGAVRQALSRAIRKIRKKWSGS